MSRHNYTLFKTYPFTPGQKIRIEGGRRAGDWEVTAVNEEKVTLRCPVSGKEFSWPLFCYVVSEEEGRWPEI